VFVWRGNIPICLAGLHISVHLRNVDRNCRTRAGSNLSQWSNRRDHWCSTTCCTPHFARHLYRWRNSGCVHLHHGSWAETITGQIHGSHRHHLQRGLLAGSVCKLCSVEDSRGRDHGQLGLADSFHFGASSRGHCCIW